MLYMEENLDKPLKEILEIIQNRIKHKSSYFGISTWKNPLDFWVYGEIMFETMPDVVIEIGTYLGGSTLALAHICDHLGRGEGY